MERFAKETGIKRYNWELYWNDWSSALRDAEFEPNTFGDSYGREELIQKFIELIRKLGRFPLRPEIRRETRLNPSFPSHATYFKQFGAKPKMVSEVLAYCQSRTEFEDVIKICLLLPSEEKPETEEEAQKPGQSGYVYLWKSHKRYKIGKTFDLDRREGELAAQSPYGWERIHEIKTDDPSGVEAYWHRRFKDKATDRNEWFELSGEDVKAFKRWRNIY